MRPVKRRPKRKATKKRTINFFMATRRYAKSARSLQEYDQPMEEDDEQEREAREMAERMTDDHDSKFD